MRTVVLAALLIAAAAVPPAGALPSTPELSRPAEASGTVVVPDRFLRRWDPLTVFFATDVGPAGGGPEDDPDRVVRLMPAHPGAFTWLDARTLQFRPADPWPPLTRFTVTIEGREHRLATLMETPTRTAPAAGAEGLDRIESIALTFASPLPPEALRRMVAIELRPLPGIGDGPTRRIAADDFTVKAVERSGRSDPATYVLDLGTPIPLGTRALLRLRLALDDAEGSAFAEIPFATAEPFRVVSLGCGGSMLPVTPDGSRFAREQALRCDPDATWLTVRFSAPPAGLGPVEARNLVRLTPAVNGLEPIVSGTTLTIRGRFARETLYRLTLSPVPLVDGRGRPLEMRGESEAFLAFPRQAPYLGFAHGEGIVERHGPQLVPLAGRGDERVDLRVHRVDPLDRSFWPFAERPIASNDDRRPPGPGEEPGAFSSPQRNANAYEVTARIAALGSPVVSTLVDLPLRKEAAAARFGLDLAPYLARAAGQGAPGTYLVGMRRLGAGAERSWMRVQVTDLALTTMEEPDAVRFVVTSIASARPVAGAVVTVEGSVWHREGSFQRWETLFQGATDADGGVRWQAPGDNDLRTITVRRIHVVRDDDVLVLDPARPPERFHEGSWTPDHDPWLQWAFAPLGWRGDEARTLCHVFTDRPVYRPDETVHVKGYLRRRDRGRLSIVRGDGQVVVEGPGDLVWRFPVALTEAGSFYHAFKADDLPTGIFTASYENNKGERYGSVSFRMEAYRIPEFEVHLSAPERAPLDRDFEVGLTATYYAGGRVAGQPVRWRVTQFPYTWRPAAREGFVFSTDSRYAQLGRFEATPALVQEATTDGEGGARLAVNPAIETTAQPRTYVVEATVTGADDQTVTAVEQVVALPPFVLGLKAPRYLERADTLEPEILVLGLDGKELTGQEVTVRLLHRQWHSVLQASDFSEGTARYLTDVVDEEAFATTVTSAAEALRVPLPITQAGVWVVEISSADRLGRSQRVAVDLYAGGGEPVAWAKPTTSVFRLATDQREYRPGATARVVLESPFQRGRALAVLETPDGNQYRWLDVEGGAATLEVPIEPQFVPELPVHVVLMRGRVPGTAPAAGSVQDLGKPATMASSVRLKVTPVEHRVDVKLEHPERATPGQEVEVIVRLADAGGRPLAGEVTLWLVDQAVLALGREQRLDPVPDFITPVAARLDVHDTRNLSFGQIAFAELPGGDGGERDESLLARTTVRRRFESVPFYDPAIIVGANGVATVRVKLPDNLTKFKLRAKAACGPDRFGVGTSQIAVRLPVIVQPALPRFVRPGDSFTAAAIGRVVEGEGGPGRAELAVEGMTLEGGARRDVTWEANAPQRIEFQVTVPTPEGSGHARQPEAVFRVAVERSADQARDAFEVRIPVREDRAPVTVRTLATLEPGTQFSLPALAESARPGTLARSLLVSDQAGLVRMAAGLDFLLGYPHGCTEQRVSRARAALALRRFRDVLTAVGQDERLDRAVRDTLASVGEAIDGNGLVAYWPGSAGSVSLTAWVVQFLVEARDAGYPVDEKTLDRLLRTLEQALRSDYSRFIDGASWAERCWALAALTRAGRPNPAYAAELARKAQFLDTEGVALVLQSLAASGQGSSSTASALVGRIWDGIVLRLWQGREVYGGLQETASARSALILPSETRTVAEVTRAVTRAEPASARRQMLVDALVTLGRDDGWGDTNANAAALLALAELLGAPAATPHEVSVVSGGTQTTLEIGAGSAVASLRLTSPAAVEASLASGPGPVIVRAETRFVPQADGSTVAPSAAGFVVSRELLVQKAEGVPPNRVALDEAGRTVELALGTVIEEHVQVVSPGERHYVAIVVPLAAGVEPLNPALATAPPEARPSKTNTLAPTYTSFGDDAVAFYFNTLPKGTYDFYFRTRATTPGSFIQPPAQAELMYDGAVRGNGAGARVNVRRE